jgi:hypothetical protein
MGECSGMTPDEARHRLRDMIRIAKTSRGLLVFAVPGGWGDWYQVALFDEALNEIASDENELHEEADLSSSLVSVGIPEGEARAFAAQLVPEPLSARPGRWRLRRK